jgi:hypothetical protein
LKNLKNREIEAAPGKSLGREIPASPRKELFFVRVAGGIPLPARQVREIPEFVLMA